MELPNYNRLAYGNIKRGMAPSKEQYHQQQQGQHHGAPQSVPYMIYAHCPGKASALTATLDCLSFLNDQEVPLTGVVSDSAPMSPSIEQRLKAVFSNKCDDAVPSRLTSSFVSPPEYSYCSDKEAYSTGPTTQFSGSSLHSDKSPQCCSSNASLSSPFTSSSGDSVCDVCLFRDGCQRNLHQEVQTLHRLDYPVAKRAVTQQQQDTILTLSRAANCFKADPFFHLLNSPQSAENAGHPVTQSQGYLSVIASPSVLVPAARTTHRNPQKDAPVLSSIRPNGADSSANCGRADLGYEYQPATDTSALEKGFASNRFCRRETLGEQQGCEKGASILGTQPTDLSQQTNRSARPATPYGSERGGHDDCQQNLHIAESEAVVTPSSPYNAMETQRQAWLFTDKDNKSRFLKRVPPSTTGASEFSNFCFQSFSADLLDCWTVGKREKESSSLAGPLSFGHLMTQSLSPTNDNMDSFSTPPVSYVPEEEAYSNNPGRVQLLVPPHDAQRVSASSEERGKTSNVSSSTLVTDSLFQHFLQSSCCPSTEARSIASYNHFLDGFCGPDKVHQTVQAFLHRGLVAGCNEASGESIGPWQMLEEVSSGMTESKNERSTPSTFALPASRTIKDGFPAKTGASVPHTQFSDVPARGALKPLQTPQHAPGTFSHLQSRNPAFSLRPPVKETQQKLSVIEPDDSTAKAAKKKRHDSGLLLSSLPGSSKDSNGNGPISSKGVCLIYKRIDEISDFPEPRIPPLHKQHPPLVVDPEAKVSQKPRPLVMTLNQREESDIRTNKWKSPYSSDTLTTLVQQNDHHCHQSHTSEEMQHLSLSLLHPMRDKQRLWPLQLAINPSGPQVQCTLAESKYCDRETTGEHKKK